mmetsp:Transcript_21485/g.28797  ORF Transcript_21485/g.28797 Transcript_21485/m.28797 type:complete len:110 (+) Transcript_21485:1657-1986(+)
MPEWKRRGARCLKNVVYNSILDTMNLLFTVFVVALGGNVDINDPTDLPTILGLTLNYIFCADMIANFICLGFWNVIMTRKLVLFELILQCLAIAQMIVQVVPTGNIFSA